MAGRTLAVNVTTPDETGRMVTYLAGESVSAEVAKGITAENVWAEVADKASNSPAPVSKAASKAPAKKSSSTTN